MLTGQCKMWVYFFAATFTRMLPRSLDSPALIINSFGASAESVSPFLPVRMSVNAAPGVRLSNRNRPSASVAGAGTPRQMPGFGTDG